MSRPSEEEDATPVRKSLTQQEAEELIRKTQESPPFEKRLVEGRPMTAEDIRRMG